MQNNIILRKEKPSQTYKNCPIYEKLKMRNHMTKNTSTYIGSNFELVRKDLTKEKNKIKAIRAGLPASTEKIRQLLTHNHYIETVISFTT